jgi:hypothetical protein
VADCLAPAEALIAMLDAAMPQRAEGAIGVNFLVPFRFLPMEPEQSCLAKR